jgi:hypothetical protein
VASVFLLIRQVARPFFTRILHLMNFRTHSRHNAKKDVEPSLRKGANALKKKE